MLSLEPSHPGKERRGGGGGMEDLCTSIHGGERAGNEPRTVCTQLTNSYTMHLPRPTIDLRKEQVRHQTSNDDLSSQLTEKQEELKELLEELQFGRENMDNLQTHALAQASLARQEVRDFKNGTSTNGTREREERERRT